MKAAYICFRPYQVFNAINMVYNNVENTRGCSDLYLQDMPVLTSLVPQLRRLGVFQNVYLFSELNRGASARAGIWNQLKIYTVRTWNLIFARSALHRNCPEAPYDQLFQYDLVLSSGWISFFMEMANCNPQARVVMFEDGTSSYVYDQIETLPKVRRIYYSILRTLFHKGPLCVDVQALYLYHPSMVIGTRKVPIYPLEKIDDGLFSVLCQAFGYDRNDTTYAGNAMVFFGQPMSPDNVPEYDEYAIVSELAKNHTLIYRKHPLQQGVTAFSFEDQKRLMWELACREIDHNCVLVGQFSTAQMTPKLLYGHAPKLVFFYKISYRKEVALLEQFQQMIAALRKNYGNDIYEPETIEEFQELMAQL